MYEYKAKIVRVVDGDTFDAEVDVGFSITIKHRFRLANIDTPETWRPKSEAEREHGERATLRVRELVEGKVVRLFSSKLGIYGRYMATVHIEGVGNLAEMLRKEGFEKKQSSNLAPH